MKNKSSKGVEPFEYNIWGHVDLNERIDWTEEDDNDKWLDNRWFCNHGEESLADPVEIGEECLICGRKEE